MVRIGPVAPSTGPWSATASMSAVSDPVVQARSLLERGRPAEARDLLAGALAKGTDGAPLRSLMGLVLHQLGDLTGCARELQEAVRLAPADGPAEFALASISFRLGLEAEAEAAARRAIDKGMDELHPYLLLGRILDRRGRLAEAEAAYRTAVRRDPTSPQAQRELAQLVWMRTGDLAAARAELDAAPQTHEIVAITVRLLQDAAEDEAAYKLAVARANADPTLNVVAARAALKFDPREAEQRLSMAPAGVTPVARAKAEIEVDLALGRAAQSARRAEALHAARPDDHHATALLATAWRLAGDARYRALYDYDRLVKSYRIDPPEGWSSLEAYLGELGEALDRLHGLHAPPVGQSVRHGTQTQRSLLDDPDPAIRAIFGAIDGPIRRHLAAIGEPDRAYGFTGAWSVRLNGGGFHIDHIHPEGRLSSAFYVRTPSDLKGDEGALKFGQPGPPTAPPLAEEHIVRPEPGLLVLFPSYMWHGTVPFDSSERRLACAFDIVW